MTTRPSSTLSALGRWRPVASTAVRPPYRAAIAPRAPTKFTSDPAACCAQRAAHGERERHALRGRARRTVREREALLDAERARGVPLADAGARERDAVAVRGHRGRRGDARERQRQRAAPAVLHHRRAGTEVRAHAATAEAPPGGGAPRGEGATVGSDGRGDDRLRLEGQRLQPAEARAARLRRRPARSGHRKVRRDGHRKRGEPRQSERCQRSAHVNQPDPRHPCPPVVASPLF